MGKNYIDGLKSTEFITRRNIRFKPSLSMKRVNVRGTTTCGRDFEAFGFDKGTRIKGKDTVRCIVVSIDGKFHLMEFPTSNKRLVISVR